MGVTPDLTLHKDAFGAYGYRPLKQGVNGADTYALQTLLNGHGLNARLVLDGSFGPKTKAAVVVYQKGSGLVVDGIAGTDTQRHAAMQFLTFMASVVPFALLYGLLENESGFQLGNFTPRYRDGSWDRGIAQLNSVAKEPSDALAFNVPVSCVRLARELKERFDSYEPKVGEREAWHFAAGSWNAPAWADAVVFDHHISAEHRARLATYIDRACTYFDHGGIPA